MLNCVPFNLMGRLAGSVSQTAYSDTVDIGYCDGPRSRGFGCFRQRSCYLCNDGGPSSIEDKVAISKVTTSNGHCMHCTKKLQL